MELSIIAFIVVHCTSAITVFSLVNSAVNVTLPAFTAERHAAPGAVDRYLWRVWRSATQQQTRCTPLLRSTCDVPRARAVELVWLLARERHHYLLSWGPRQTLVMKTVQNGVL